jgi:serine/threonine protein kinase
MPREASFLRRCQHPNVITAYTWDSYGLLVVERAPMDLGMFVKQCRQLYRPSGAAAAVADVVARLYLASTACVGLAHVHSCAVLHGDIKINNVVVACGGGIDGGVLLQRVIATHRDRYPVLGRYSCKIIDFSRSCTVGSPADGGVTAAAGSERVPAGGSVAVRRSHRMYWDVLAPELFEPRQPYHCRATDVHAMVMRVLNPLLRHPVSSESVLTSFAATSDAVRCLLVACDRAIAHDPSERPTAVDLSVMLCAALADVAASSVAVE